MKGKRPSACGKAADSVKGQIFLCGNPAGLSGCPPMRYFFSFRETLLTQDLKRYSDIYKEESPMLRKKSFYFVLTILIFNGARLWAGDNASFVDLGFSPDGAVYMFAQYGVESNTLRPWAELAVVDVPKNNFVAGGRVSYTHTGAVTNGQDGSGALYRLIARNGALAERYGVDFLLQGYPLYISVETSDTSGDGGEIIEFRDFQAGASYRATLIPTLEGSGSSLKSSFFINLERTAGNGSKRSYKVGSPGVKRPLISSYRIRKVMIAPQDGSLIFVIEMKRPGNGGFDIRYMAEALRL
jgi:predicted secreted protein